MIPYYSDEGLTLFHGKNMDVLPSFPDAHFDAVVCDPPYELTAGKKGGTGVASLNPNSPAGRSRIGTGFMGKAWDGSGIAFDVAMWAEVFRVLKPGGHLLAFGGSRTWHRMAVAIEDAGFEMRDSIAWLYGSGFPKSMDVSKAIDKGEGHWRGKAGEAKSGNSSMTGANYERTEKGDPVTVTAAAWQGWGTALKPAFEPIVVARKPLVGTVAANVLAHGTGALNIDATRTVYRSEADKHANDVAAPGLRDSRSGFGGGMRSAMNDTGRWPTNVVLDESQAKALDQQSGVLTSGVMKARTERAPTKGGTIYGAQNRNIVSGDTYGDSGGASRFFPTFRYEAKAPGSERPEVDGTQHATVKPLGLMRWLVRLVTPPNGLVLDPFAGSGTTGEACLIEGFRCTLIEMEADHLPLIMQRIKKPVQQSLFGDWDES